MVRIIHSGHFGVKPHIEKTQNPLKKAELWCIIIKN